MTTVEYLSLSKPKRMLVKIGSFFKNIPVAIYKFFCKLPIFGKDLLKKAFIPFKDLYNALIYGDWKVRLSFILCGFGQITRHQVIKGIAVLAYEIAFITYMVLTGGQVLFSLGNLGMLGMIESIDPELGIPVYQYHDNSMLTLIYAMVTIFLCLFMLVLWLSSIRAAKKLYDMEKVGKYSSVEDFKRELTGNSYHVLLLSVPMFGVLIFTIIPIIIMILIGFTNYNSNHETPAYLFEWVGFFNYSNIFTGGGSSNNIFLTTFLKVLLWTLVWAFFATFSNYFLGMIVALIINQKNIKFKKLWRTILITTIAVPSFVSLLLMSRLLNKDLGFVNNFLIQIGLIEKGIKWLESPILTKVVIIVINTWIGIPYTMLICTGILMNIPEDLYESAKIDGASPSKMYMKITLPYMLFVTGPYLISQFVGNINNFNVIYLLSQGGPMFTFNGASAPPNLQGVGETDLLITWIYKLTMTNAYKDYGLASVLGVLIFCVVAFISLVFYSKSNAVKNEEDFK